MNNSGLLTIIAVLLLGILVTMFIQLNERTPAEKVSDSMSNAINTVSEEIAEEQ